LYEQITIQFVSKNQRL